MSKESAPKAPEGLSEEYSATEIETRKRSRKSVTIEPGSSIPSSQSSSSPQSYLSTELSIDSTHENDSSRRQSLFDFLTTRESLENFLVEKENLCDQIGCSSEPGGCSEENNSGQEQIEENATLCQFISSTFGSALENFTGMVTHLVSVDDLGPYLAYQDLSPYFELRQSRSEGASLNVTLKDMTTIGSTRMRSEASTKKEKLNTGSAGGSTSSESSTRRPRSAPPNQWNWASWDDLTSAVGFEDMDLNQDMATWRRNIHEPTSYIKFNEPIPTDVEIPQEVVRSYVEAVTIDLPEEPPITAGEGSGSDQAQPRVSHVPLGSAQAFMFTSNAAMFVDDHDHDKAEASPSVTTDTNVPATALPSPYYLHSNISDVSISPNEPLTETLPPREIADESKSDLTVKIHVKPKPFPFESADVSLVPKPASVVPEVPREEPSVAPGVPTEEPSEPEAPELQTEEPTEPVAPELPTEPSEPESSELTTEPSEPVAPELPTEPSEPESPELTTEPSEPVAPELPTEPSEPESPELTTEPSEPEAPELQTEEPTEPVAPELPTEPAEAPELPTEEPSEPEAPELPTEPSKPEAPELPSKPIAKVLPTSIRISANPSQKTVPIPSVTNKIKVDPSAGVISQKSEMVPRSVPVSVKPSRARTEVPTTQRQEGVSFAYPQQSVPTVDEFVIKYKEEEITGSKADVSDILQKPEESTDPDVVFQATLTEIHDGTGNEPKRTLSVDGQEIPITKEQSDTILRPQMDQLEGNESVMKNAMNILRRLSQVSLEHQEAETDNSPEKAVPTEDEGSSQEAEPETTSQPQRTSRKSLSRGSKLRKNPKSNTKSSRK